MNVGSVLHSGISLVCDREEDVPHENVGGALLVAKLELNTVKRPVGRNSVFI